MYLFKDLLEYFKDLYQNRELIAKFSKNDFKSRYAGSFLGILWAFIQPTVTIAVYWVVFGLGLKSSPAGGMPFVLFLITGIIVWFFFSEGLVNGTNCFREYNYLVKKVTFNIKILPTVKIISSLYTHAFFIAFAVVMVLLYGYSITPYFLQIFYYLFCLIVFLTGLTWVTASLQPFFTDILQFINVAMQVLFWGTPILVPIETYPVGLLRIMKLNPLYYIVQGYRESFFGQGWFWQHPVMTAYFWGFTFVLLLVGIAVYRKLRPHFSDVL
ncbi:ABC transporter permease [Acetobacterium paludosum]|uniref:Transport permease protein n=1 Tax=Acetobacterium paludosum TaxID=52693 RepID=A0A923I1C9_9FIRM|nr:ABC transporter permease [Acetobacterium paludosum]MBC3889901.1 ABC transporter permease [Acetobacterium paludosum]